MFIDDWNSDRDPPFEKVMDEKKYENIKKWEYEQRMKEIEKIQ